MNSRTLSTEPPFDHARYEILRPLGAGGAGDVYLAYDRETGEQLALKKLQRIDQKSVLRFKREFRSLVGLHHPNLIRLYNLGRGPDAWFLTMEFVEGRNLNDALRGVYATRTTSANDQDPDRTFFKRVLGVFQQLAAGVRAVHLAGMLHRDLKPSNVIIARGGRVVLLDFGLVRDLDVASELAQLTQDGMITGTPAYMSPEQASAQPLTQASDWYAFGVMLYETLSGQLPIAGRNALDLIQRKLVVDATALDDALDCPAALRELCMQLLQRDPMARPSGEQVVAALAALAPEVSELTHTQTEELVPQTVTQVFSAQTLFGRATELAALGAARDRAMLHENVVVHVRGSSGAGKSALVESFLDDPSRGKIQDVVVMRSSCYEQESMPFKALDGMMDAVVAHMLTLPDVEAAFLLPPDVVELAQLFPIFDRLPVIQRLFSGKVNTGEAAEVRRRAENALLELLRQLASRRPIIIWIDDLQWGDLDSAQVLKNWLMRPTDAPFLIIFSYRREEMESSPCLKVLLDHSTRANEVVIDITLLADAEIRALCSQPLSNERGLSPTAVERIVAEAQGSPFLAQQLVALAIAKQTRGEVDMGNLSLEALVLRAGALLQPEARELLNVLAIAGRPIAPRLALKVAKILYERRNHIHALQGLRLVRTRFVDGQRWLEVYHDRVRTAVRAALSAPELARLQARLLDVLEESGVTDPDWLHDLALDTNNSAAALRYGLLAADRASASLAFERAAELYARCLRLNDRPESAGELWMKLAAALAHSRRGVQAAEAYLQAAQRVAPDAQAPVLRLAAAHLLRSGRFEEGERLVCRVLELLELSVPTTELGLLAAIGWERARLAARGYELKLREPSEATDRLMRTSELYGTLAVDTQLHEPVRAVLFQMRALRLALESGDRSLAARTMCLTATVVCVSGTPRAARHSGELIERAENLSLRSDSADLAIELPSVRALCAVFLGRPREVLRYHEAADKAYAARTLSGGLGDYFYMFAVHAARLGALQALGRHSAAFEALRDYLARAEATDNRAAILQATLFKTVTERTNDNCVRSRARLDAEREQLPKGSFGILHLLHMIATMHAACATGEHDWAIGHLADDWPVYLRSPIHGTAYLACIAHFAHARLLLNQHVALAAKGDVAQTARPDLRALARLPATELRDRMMLRLQVRCSYLQGDLVSALRMLRQSAIALNDAIYLDETERDRIALGGLIGGLEGAQLIASAEAALRDAGVREPMQELRGYYPELFASGVLTEVLRTDHGEEPAT